MHPEPMLIDAQHARTQLHRWHARHRLAELAATSDGEHRHGFRYRVGVSLIAAGRRIQGATVSLPEAPSRPAPRPAR